MAARRFSTSLAIGLSALIAASSARASGSAQGTLNVAALVASTCSVASATLDFGVVNPTSGASLSASANILVQCTLGTSYTVALGAGQNASGAQRRMRGSASSGYLSYALYADPAGTTPFGGAPGQTVAAVGLGVTPNSIPVYGSVPSGQSSPADTYADTVAITVAY